MYNCELNKLNIYKLSRQFSKESWEIYSNLDWQGKKIIGDQFIRAVDSVGANIVEGFGRYYFKDKVRFYYNARASLLEAEYWLKLFREREIIDENSKNNIFLICRNILPQLNSFIRYTINKQNN